MLWKSYVGEWLCYVNSFLRKMTFIGTNDFLKLWELFRYSDLLFWERDHSVMLIAIRNNKFGSCPNSVAEVSMPLSLQPALSWYSITLTRKSETKANCQYADNLDFAEILHKNRPKIIQNFCSVPETFGHLWSQDFFGPPFCILLFQSFFSVFPWGTSWQNDSASAKNLWVQLWFFFHSC